MDIRDHIERNGPALLAVIGIGLFYGIVQTWFVQTIPTGYDSFRNLILVEELLARGTFSYFGQAYAVNPPLNYLLRAILAAVTGVSLQAQQRVSTLFYLLGQVGILLTARRIFDRERAIGVFLLSGLAWTFLLAGKIRSYGYVLLFGSLIVYTYTRYLQDSSEKSAVLVGVSLGLGMLAKSSFAFLVIILTIHHIARYDEVDDIRTHILHYALFGVTAVLLYIPYILYLGVNGIKMPWTAQMMSITGGAAWMKGYTPPGHLFLYRRLFEMLPVLSLGAIGGILARWRRLYERPTGPLGFLALILLIGPLLGRLVLVKVHIYQLFFLFIPLPLLTALLLDHLEARSDIRPSIGDRRLRIWSIGLVALIVMAGIVSIPRVQDNTAAPGTVFSGSEQRFARSIDQGTVVLSEIGYSRLHFLGDGYVEHAREPNPQQFLSYSPEYYIAQEPRQRPFLTDPVRLQVSGQAVIRYRVNMTPLLHSRGLRQETLHISGDGDGVSYAWCQVAGRDWQSLHVTDRTGVLQFAIPTNYSGPIGVRCQALGYETFRGRLRDKTIDMGQKHPLVHGYPRTRY